MHTPANPEDFGLLGLLSGFLEEVWVALEHLTDPLLVSLEESWDDRIGKRIWGGHVVCRSRGRLLAWLEADNVADQ